MSRSATKGQLLGVFLITQSLLMLEVVLTRIFSVIVFYHFAVLSISLALFGSAAGGMLVYVLPGFFRKEKLGSLLMLSSLAYAVSVLVSFLILLGIPVYAHISFAGFMNLSLVYLDLAVPFFFAGLCLSLVMTHLAPQVSTVYFADLTGAASGCLLALAALELLGGPGAVVLVSAIATLASIVFGYPVQSRYRRLPRLFLAAVLMLLVANYSLDFPRIVFVKGEPERRTVYEGWNSYSRVAIFPEVKYSPPFGWGLSSTREYSNPGWMRLNIDGMAETPITRFNGDLGSVDFLRYDVSNLVYYLRPDAEVFVIGPGGGRDVLSALLFDASEVDAVELNPLIINAVRNRFGEYSGHLYDKPNVHVHVDDARNFLARSSKKYDIIQASAVDTWAATSSGAFALSENTLYTQEAFRTFEQRLTADGILAFSRFIYPEDRYGEALRLISVGLTAWKQSGVLDPTQHLIMVGNLNKEEDSGYVSLLLKASPFTRAEVDRVQAVCDEMAFSVLYAPFGLGHGLVRDLVTAQDYDQFWRAYPIDITPTTDDRPFFFQMLRLTDIPRMGLKQLLESERLRIIPVGTLGVALVVVTLLALGFVLWPLWLYKRQDLHARPRTRWHSLAYFACLGLGFMMVEVGLMQKFVLFLGHPTYSLAVVLFALLFAGGLGSFSTTRLAADGVARRASLTLVALLLLLPLFIFVLPRFQYGLMGMDQTAKIVISIACLLPVGFLLGMFFPYGIKLLTLGGETLIPWCWAINGAVSVFASVFALAIGIQFGVRAELVTGWLAYLVAFVVLRDLTRATARGTN